MKIKPQYRVAITCDLPFGQLSNQLGRGGALVVYTIEGDYESVRRALGPINSDVRGQLDRFNEALNDDNGGGQ